MDNNLNQKLDKTIKEIFCDNYVIPLYQRNFAWKKDEIQLLLQDLYENYCEYKKDQSIHYYIGTLVCLYDAQKNIYEVIDGQQRLTVLTLLSKVLQFSDCSKIHYESRPEVEDFFNELFKISDSDINSYDEKIKKFAKITVLDNFAEALDAFYESNIDAKANKIYRITDLGNERISFSNFIIDNVILLRTNIPEDTDVASYFEIMNNRGEQLKKTDVIKAQMMNEITTAETGEYDKDNQKRFSIIWNACSNMNIPIQKSFSRDNKLRLFGDDYQSIITANIASMIVDEDNTYTEKSLETILSESLYTNKSKSMSDEEDEEDSVYSSIIDFPNFLMHVIKLYCDQNQITLKNVSLDEKQLLDEFKEIKEQSSYNSMEFISYLLFYRTCLDRFIVMQKNENSNDENDFNWALVRPIRKQNSNDSNKYSFYYKRAFVFEDDNGDQEKKQKEEELTEDIIKILSLFQVTYRNKKNKRWLYDVLSLEVFNFSGSKRLNEISGEEYLNMLRKKAFEYYNDLTNVDFLDGGTGIHHYVFNYLDYLYWVAAKDEYRSKLYECSRKLTNEIELLRTKYNFDFKYYNSIEHHYAQNYLAENLKKNENDIDRIEAEKIKPYINSIGNLCIISKKANSRLSDVSPREKVQKRSDKVNTCPNRYIIYKKTVNEEKDVWDCEAIKTHKECVEELLSKSKDVLGI